MGISAGLEPMNPNRQTLVPSNRGSGRLHLKHLPCLRTLISKQLSGLSGRRPRNELSIMRKKWSWSLKKCDEPYHFLNGKLKNGWLSFTASPTSGASAIDTVMVNGVTALVYKLLRGGR